MIFNPGNYDPPTHQIWWGRKTSLRSQYWYQQIRLVNLAVEGLGEKNADIPRFGIIGYACDDGVRRNQGRPGAKNGPREIRKQLGKLAWHGGDKIVFDLGNVTCLDQDMEGSQQVLGDVIQVLLGYNIFPIAIGGGHDLVYGHFVGVQKFHQLLRKSKIGIVNFDAHFDLRSTSQEASSGTPFYQILSEHSDTAYFVIGIQPPSNQPELCLRARELKVEYIDVAHCHFRYWQEIATRLTAFLNGCDRVMISVDLDSFASPYAPGVSAPSPLGFTPDIFFAMLDLILASEKCISFDVVELNPDFDVDDQTAQLASRIVNHLVIHHQVKKG